MEDGGLHSSQSGSGRKGLAKSKFLGETSSPMLQMRESSGAEVHCVCWGKEVFAIL